MNKDLYYSQTVGQLWLKQQLEAESRTRNVWLAVGVLVWAILPLLGGVL